MTKFREIFSDEVATTKWITSADNTIMKASTMGKAELKFEDRLITAYNVLHEEC
jgi:hypothetical protein